jgi:protein dithiol oxidoreductase (disulfide-forming)
MSHTSGFRRHMLRRIACMISVAFALTAIWAPIRAAQPPLQGSDAQTAASPPAGSTEHWTSGVNYEELNPPVVVKNASGKTLVLEFFDYECPHCFALEPYIQEWNQRKPHSVEFEQVPVVWSPAGEAYARLFYTIRRLGREDLHQAIFDVVHANRRSLFSTESDVKTRALQTQFSVQHGIRSSDFVRVYDSQPVREDVERDRALMKAFKIDAVPLLSIGGRYITSPGRAKGERRVVPIVDYLLQVDHSAKNRPAAG